MSLDISCNVLEQGQLQTVQITVKPTVKGGSKMDNFIIEHLALVRLKFVQEVTQKTLNIPTLQNPTGVRDISSNTLNSYEYIQSPRPVHVAMSYKKSSTVAKDFRVKLNIHFKPLNYSAQLVCPDNWTEWIHIGNVATKFKKPSHSISYKCFDLKVTMAVSKAEVITFAKLYDDTITTDFNMSVKGSTNVVPMHRNCLLAHSDMFKTLFQSGDFTDKKDFQVGIKDVTDQTIRDLKRYIYLGELPDTGLCQLLLLAKCYLFENLKSECITNMAQTATHKNLNSLISFACENNVPELVMTLMQLTSSGLIHQAYLMEKYQERKRTHDEPETSTGRKHARYTDCPIGIDFDGIMHPSHSHAG